MSICYPFLQILMNVSGKKTCATLMQLALIQLAVMSVLVTMDSKEMALPTAQVCFCRNAPKCTLHGCAPN